LFTEICNVRSHSYIASAKKILEEYNGAAPFAGWLKNYFRENKKFGSKDRKIVAHLCFSYFRLGNGFSEMEIDERFLTGQFLCSTGPSIILQELKPEWNEMAGQPLREKLVLLHAEKEMPQIFSFTDYMSDEIDKAGFAASFLVQPDLFLRIRPGRRETVVQKLAGAQINFIPETDETLRLANNSKIEEALEIDDEVVVQDLNSQQVLSLLPLQAINAKKQTAAWDCCAASGGKSIQAFDLIKKIHLTVSDIRETILHNLENRFKRARIKNYRAFITDLSKDAIKLPDAKFDLVICDAPCSGSGTWARTPEQLRFFKKEKISYYSGLQKAIALNVCRALHPGGYFLYITCSVFAKENEETVAFIKENSSLQLEAMQYFKGYDKKADTLFAALFSAL
jgi:16S rRNA (cytosine967-C5)-methyltransferase